MTKLTDTSLNISRKPKSQKLKKKKNYLKMKTEQNNKFLDCWN